MHHLGLTRSSTYRDHMLLTPDTFIRTPLPGLRDGMAIVHVSPQAGAAFSMMTVELEPGGILTEGPAQRFGQQHGDTGNSTIDKFARQQEAFQAHAGRKDARDNQHRIPDLVL